MDEQVSKIQQYWDDRAIRAKLNPNATTDDVYLRELEIRTFAETIKRQKKLNLYVLDLGCGDGFTTLKIAKEFPDIRFLGVDYSDNMIANAKLRLSIETDIKLKERIEFKTGDATKLQDQFEKGTFDIVITARCLINLTSTKQQYEAINQISNILSKNGVYISSENFEDGSIELNQIRNKIGLPEIPIRWHNKFFNEKEYLNRSKASFKSVKIINYSSSYYYATRVIYSKFCQMNGIEPDYFHDIHKLSIDLPSTGNYSPIKLVIHRK
jgi:ubiquinone/menaquinone biosynthesis C-methylase UbiE